MLTEAELEELRPLLAKYLPQPKLKTKAKRKPRPYQRKLNPQIPHGGGRKSRDFFYLTLTLQEKKIFWKGYNRGYKAYRQIIINKLASTKK